LRKQVLSQSHLHYKLGFKGKIGMKNYFKLLRFLRGHKRIFIFAVVFMLFTAVFEGVQLSMLVPMTDIIFTQKKIIIPNKVPDFVSHFIEKLNNIPPESLLSQLLLAFFILLLVKNFVSFWYGFLMNDVSQRVMRDIRNKLYHTIQHLSLDYFSRKRSGELISRITNDVQVIENAISYGVTDLFRQTFIIVMFIAIALGIYLKAALIVFLLFPLIALPVGQLGRKLRKLSKSSQEKMADINSLLLETITGVKVVKAFCTEDYETERFRKQNHDYYKIKMKSIKRLMLISPITELIGAFCGVTIILWLGRQLMRGELSFGIFVLFFGSIMSIISPIKKLGNVNAMTQQALAANDRIYDILETQATIIERVGAIEIPTMRHGLEIKDVTFQYAEESGVVLTNINFNIQAGELVAIVGPTGSGKSTLVSLIPRLYDPHHGEIRIDGVNLKEVTFKSLRRQIGIVAQETVLFNDTVRANIAYGTNRTSQQEIEAAARKAFAHDFVKDMPQGYDTVIGDRGFRLSGGEKQRIAIARAILRNPPILILDEATSQLDSQSEQYVQEALDKLMEGKTVICIAHRLSTIKKAKKIIVFEAGRIVGLDAHDNLLKNCPLYHKLYETQFQM